MNASIVYLPYGNAPVRISDLEAHVSGLGGWMIIGGENATFVEHGKRYSLDFWLRERAGNRRDTRQSTREFIRVLCGTGRFRESRDWDPKTGKPCNSIRLAKH